MVFNTQDLYYFREGDTFSLKVKGIVTRRLSKDVPCFDAAGKFIFKQALVTHADSEEDVLLAKGDDPLQSRTLIQIDFKFYILPVLSNEPSRVEGCQALINRLSKSGVRGLALQATASDWLGGLFDKKDYVKSRFFSEMCLPGSRNYSVVKDSPLAMRKFDYKAYEEEKETFVARHPDWRREVEELFRINLNLVAAFYYATPESIKLYKYDKLTGALKRLNLKITNLKKK